MTFAAVGAVVLPSNPAPKRPSLAKAKTALNFKLTPFEKLGIAMPQSDHFPRLSDPCTMDLPEVTRALPDEGLAGGQYLVQPLPTGTIIDPSPSLSPEESGGMSSPSTIQQFIITRTPPEVGNWPSAQDGSPGADSAAPGQSHVAQEQSAPVPTASSSTEGQQIHSESQWMFDEIPRIGSFGN